MDNIKNDNIILEHNPSLKKANGTDNVHVNYNNCLIFVSTSNIIQMMQSEKIS